MNKVFLCGDTHGQIDWKKLTTKGLKMLDISMGEGDFLIVLGDWGGIWYPLQQPSGMFDGRDQYIIDWYESKPWTTVIVLGNHENYDTIMQLPTEYWHGAQVWRVSSKIVIIQRGEIFSLCGKKFFAMGGAYSIDKPFRKLNVSWWEQELPSTSEYEKALNKLDDHMWSVDYILTHCASVVEHQYLTRDYEEVNSLINFLTVVKSTLTYKRHYFAHYHIDFDFTDINSSCLFYRVIELK